MRNNDDLEINAYLDDELSAGDRVEMLEAMQRDPELARRACELGHLKNQIQLAFANPPGLVRSEKRIKPTTWAGVAAGLVVLGAGVFGGWALGHLPSSQANRFVLLNGDGLGNAPATANSKETRIVFQVTNANQTKVGEMLDDVSQMLHAYKQAGKPLRVEIVTNGDGLDLLREHLSHFKTKIHQLASTYPNLTFVACKNTIQRVEVSEGIVVHLLPDTQLTGSGVNHVVQLQKKGWIYIRV